MGWDGMGCEYATPGPEEIFRVFAPTNPVWFELLLCAVPVLNLLFVFFPSFGLYPSSLLKKIILLMK